MLVHAAADIEEQHQVERLGFLAEIGDRPRLAVIEDAKILHFQSGRHAAAAIEHQGIHFDERHAGAEDRSVAWLLGEGLGGQ